MVKERCTKFRSGDRGQRYEVRALNADDNPFVVGWTDAKDGGSLVKMVEKHPEWHDPVVVDRRADAN